MLYVSLVLSVVLVGLAQYAARKHPEPNRGGVLVGIGGALKLLGLFSGGVALFRPAILFACLVASLVAWRYVRTRVRTFVPFSLASLAVAYGICGWAAYRD